MLMSSAAPRRAVVVLFVLAVFLAAANMLFTVHEIAVSNRARCQSLEQLVAIPIPQPVAGHESREYASRLRAAYRHRAIELGCPGVTR